MSANLRFKAKQVVQRLLDIADRNNKSVTEAYVSVDTSHIRLKNQLQYYINFGMLPEECVNLRKIPSLPQTSFEYSVKLGGS